MIVDLKRSLDLRWLFDDLCFIRLRWSCFKGRVPPKKIEWHLPWVGGSRAPSRFFLQFFAWKNIWNHFLTIKTRFAHSLSFILLLFIYSSWDDPEQGWIWQSAVNQLRMSILKQLKEDLKGTFLTETNCKIRFIYVRLNSKRKKWGLNGWELVP